MPNNPSIQEEKARSFLDRYVKMVHGSGMKEPFDRWMVVRAEESRGRDTVSAPARKWSSTNNILI